MPSTGPEPSAECTWEACFGGSVLLETFDIEVVSYDGKVGTVNLKAEGMPEPWTWTLATLAIVTRVLEHTGLSLKNG